jgi:pimeloyl-ACP methyl ester carboxylesterase
MMLPGSGFALRQLLRSRTFLRSNAGFGGCFVDRGLIDGEFHEQFIAPLIASAERTEGQIRYARGIDWNQLDQLATDHAKIRGPVLLVWGDRDRFFPIDQARAMIPQFRECRGLVEIPGTRLLPFEEKPDVVLPHIESFLG